jgi:hypothetical protein
VFGDAQVKLVDTREIEPGQSQEASQRASGASREPAEEANKQRACSGRHGAFCGFWARELVAMPVWSIAPVLYNPFNWPRHLSSPPGLSSSQIPSRQGRGRGRERSGSPAQHASYPVAMNPR